MRLFIMAMLVLLISCTSPAKTYPSNLTCILDVPMAPILNELRFVQKKYFGNKKMDYVIKEHTLVYSNGEKLLCRAYIDILLTKTNQNLVIKVFYIPDTDYFVFFMPKGYKEDYKGTAINTSGARRFLGF